MSACKHCEHECHCSHGGSCRTVECTCINCEHNALDEFWKNLNVYVNKKYSLTETASMDKYTQLCQNILSLKNFKNYERYDNFIYTIFFCR